MFNLLNLILVCLVCFTCKSLTGQRLPFWKLETKVIVELVQTLRMEMSCFHLFWLENAGWTGAFGSGAAFWEPGKFVAEEERNLEN